MINFKDLKAEIAKIAKVEAGKIKIGFTKRVYEITAEGATLSKEDAEKIVTLLGEAVVKTIAFVSESKDTVIVVFDMN